MSAVLIGLSILMVIIGIIILVIGVILYSQNNKSATTQPWYVWLYLVGGIIIAVLGAILLGWGIIKSQQEKKAQKKAAATSIALAGEQPIVPTQSALMNPYSSLIDSGIPI